MHSVGLALLVFVLRTTKWQKMRNEQSVGSYPTPRRTVTADISPRYEDFSGSVIVSPAVDTTVDNDCYRSRRSFQTFELIIL